MQIQSAKLLFKNTSFRSFLATRLFITLGFQMQAVIIGWKLYDLTHNAFSLGLIGLAEAIPALSVALYAGHLADIRNKKHIMLLCLIGLLLSSAGLFASTSSLLELSTDFRVKLIYFFIFLSGIARGFYAPSSFSLIPRLVPREQLAQAGTFNSTTWQFAAVVGPASGGLIYGFWGIQVTFLFILGLMSLSLFFLSRVKGDFTPHPQPEEALSLRLKEGIRFVYTNKVILSALSLDLFSVLFGGVTALLPIFANEILNTGPEGLGILRAAPSLGAVISMGLIGVLPVIQLPGKVLIRVVFGFGICMIAFALSESFWLSVFFLFLSGALDGISVVIRSNILQLQTPDHMRGRVSSVNTMFIGSSNEIGAFESGLAAKLLGTIPSVIFGGSMTLLVVSIAQWKADALKKLRFDN
ncbi:MAG: MFS transporter [Bacteroidia bacterium]|nr:MFS transporter [Bacteroidia bacterium]